MTISEGSSRAPDVLVSFIQKLAPFFPHPILCSCLNCLLLKDVLVFGTKLTNMPGRQTQNVLQISDLEWWDLNLHRRSP